MGLIWPSFLFLLILLPLVVLVYVWALRRRKRVAAHYSSLSLIREAMPGRTSWRRHLPFALFLLTLAILILGLARPVATVNATSRQSTIMLALDVSLSMCASDIPPNRLTVAQEAAKTFIRGLEEGTRVGIVAFAGFAQLVAPPTADKEVLLGAVGNLTAELRTAIGSAILRSLDAIAEIDPQVAPANVFLNPSDGVADPERPGAHEPAIVVLLTDGASNRGVHPLNAAQAAADRGIRIYTIGYGTDRGAIFTCTPEQLGDFEFRNRIGRRFAGSPRLALDEDTLWEVASITGGEYYLAESSEQLTEVFAGVPGRLTETKVKREMSAILVAVGAFFALASVALAQRWNPLP